MTSHRGRQSRSKKSTTTATTTGNGEKATKSNQNTKDQSIRTSEIPTEYSTNDNISSIHNTPHSPSVNVLFSGIRDELMSIQRLAL